MDINMIGILNKISWTIDTSLSLLIEHMIFELIVVFEPGKSLGVEDWALL